MVSPGERIYSTAQLADALSAGVASLHDQLQVLAILDGTATSWPGVMQAVKDLEFLTAASSQRVATLEQQSADSAKSSRQLQSEVDRLKQSAAAAASASDKQAKELASRSRELATAQKDLAEQRRIAEQCGERVQLLEKQVAELTAAVDKYKADTDFMEGEVQDLRATNTKQTDTIGDLKQELAGRASDVAHLTQQLQQHKTLVEHVTQQVDSAHHTLEATHQELTVARGDRDHFQREVQRLLQEAARLTQELNSSVLEVEKLQQWQDIFRRVEADKLQEAAEQHHAACREYDSQVSDLQQRLQQAETAAADTSQQLQQRDQECEQLRTELTSTRQQNEELRKTLKAGKTARVQLGKSLEVRDKDIEELRQQLQVAAISTERLKAQHLLAVGQGKEAAMERQAQTQSQLEEALRGLAVEKAHGENWQRDIKNVQETAQAAEAKAMELQEALEILRREIDTNKLSQINSSVTQEAAMRELRNQLESSKQELAKARLEYAAQLKQMQAKAGSLQRENDASAAEIERLRTALNKQTQAPADAVVQVQCLAHTGAPATNLYRPCAPEQADGGLPPPVHEDFEKLRRLFASMSRQGTRELTRPHYSS